MKYCSNCGNPMEETAKFCTKCGKKNPHYVDINGRGSKPRRAKTAVAVIAAVCAVIAVAAAVIAAVSAGSGYRGNVRAYVNALAEENGQKAVALFSDAYLQYLGYTRDEYAGYLDDAFKQSLNTISAGTGAPVRARDIDIDDFERLDKYELERYISNLYDLGYARAGQIKDVAYAEVSVEFLSAGAEQDYEFQFTFFKENGKWKIAGVSGPYRD